MSWLFSAYTVAGFAACGAAKNSRPFGKFCVATLFPIHYAGITGAPKVWRWLNTEV